MEVMEALKMQHQSIRSWLADFELAVAGQASGGQEQNNTTEFKPLLEIIERDILPHFQLEEEGVLTALSMLTDIEGGSIDFMESEHHQLRDLFNQLKKEVQSGDNYARIVELAERIKGLFNSHLAREEETIYYMVNHFLTEEQLRLIEEQFKEG